MIYTEKTKKALLISFNAHKDQLDKSGIPYVYHPYEVAEHMETETETCVALLHDVVEDTDTTLDELAEIFPQEVIDALRLMTHDPEVPYLDYVKKIKDNPLARKVKLADLRHNSDLSRLNNATKKDLKRVDKYKEAIQILEN